MRIVLVLSFALAVAALAPGLAFGQVTGSGTIIGSVADQSGAVIVGAEVRLTDRSTGSYEVQPSNQVGRFTFSSVKPGMYDVAVTMKGFRKLEVANQELVLGGQLTLNLTLEVGTSTQTVEVTSTPGAELQTMNSTMSTSVTGASLIELPSIDRDVSGVLYYTPTTAPNFHGAEGNVTAGQVAGATSDQNLIYLDGGNNSSGLEGDNAYVNGGHGVVPMPMESVEEFKVNTNNMTADFNASSGAEILVTTKRGTNTWHGSGYEFYQDGALNSNDWYNNFQGITKSSAHSNRFGGSIGGPISPNVWGGKTYLYFNYEGNRYPRSSPVEMGVPSATLRAGILQFVDATGNRVQYDMKTSTACGATGGMPCDPRGIGLNPVVNQIWSQYVPQANDLHYGDLTNGNSYGYIANIRYPLTDNFFVGRIDHDFGTKWRGFFSYRWFNENNPNTSQIDWGGVLPGDKLGDPAPASSTPLKPRYFVAGVTGNLSPNVTNEFHFSYTRNYWRWNRVGGIPYISGIPDGLEFGEQNSTSGSLFAPINMDTQDSRQRLWAEHNFDYRDTLSWIKGNHYLQFGGDYMHQWWHFDRYDDVVTGLPEPIAQMAGDDDNPAMGPDYQPIPCSATLVTNCLPTQYQGAWNGLYANTLGMIGVTSVVVSRNGPMLTPNALGTPAGSFDTVPTYSLYFTDAWHIRPNLTLTYGLNYGVQMPPYEATGKQDIMVDSQGQPMNAEAYLQSKLNYANQGLIYDPAIGYSPIRDVTIGGQNKYPYLPFYGGLSPRVGLAYSPAFDSGVLHKIFGNKETVFRGGYSRFFDRSLGIDLVSTPVLGDGFLQPIACIGATMAGQCTGAAGTTPASIFRIGVDGNTAPLPAIAPTLTPPVEPGINAPGTALSATMDSAYRPGSSDEIDFSIQRQLKGNMIVEIGYTGRWAKHIFQGIDINDVPWMMVQGGQTLAKAWDAIAVPAAAGNTNPPVQPWFETALKGSAYCGGYSSCTAAVASKESSWTTTDNLVNMWADLDGSFVFGPNTVPFMNQDNWTYNDTSLGFSNFQALVATVTKRTGHGLTFNGNLTYGHDSGTATINQEYTLDNVENPWNLRTDYSPNPWDRKLVINFLSTYELPFGKGHRWTSTNGLVSRIIGGWSVDPVITWASGTPIEGYSGSCEEWGNGTDPWCAGMVPLTNVLKYGNTSHSNVDGSNGVGVAAAPGNGGVGLNLYSNPEQVFDSFRYDYVGIDGRSYDNGPMRGQRRWNLDLGITKDTRITERVGVQLFGQAFNALNHMMWGDPSLNLQSPGSFGVLGPGGAGEYGAIGNGYRRIIQIGARVSF
jgi:hypothetical protein